MGKSCLSKLSGNILVDCTLRSHGIKELYLMHVEDVTFTLAADGAQIATAAFAAGAKSYKVEGYKQNIQMTSSLRATDVSDRLDVSIMFKSVLSGSLTRGIMPGRFYVMAVYADSTGENTVWGLNSPLECSSIEYDSNANGRLATYTLTSPEGSAGNNLVTTSPAVSTSIISKSV